VNVVDADFVVLAKVDDRIVPEQTCIVVADQSAAKGEIKRAAKSVRRRSFAIDHHSRRTLSVERSSGRGRSPNKDQRVNA
jgi:hypothetical protein